jgi:hypothetical protein
VRSSALRSAGEGKKAGEARKAEANYSAAVCLTAGELLAGEELEL